jgi:hypothetical protein
MYKYRLPIGSFILIISLIADHHFTIPDFLSGLLKGFAIGILLTVIIKRPVRVKAK